MLLSSVILVLREVLEAAVLLSLLIALALNMGWGLRWLKQALVVSLLGIYAFSSCIETITDALDGMGQEVTNAALQLLVYGLCLGIVIYSARHSQTIKKAPLPIYGLMICAAACALIREGSEIYIYISGFSHVEDFRFAVWMGSILGAGIGISLGVILFAAIRSLSFKKAFNSCLLLISVIASGMVMQASLLLEQADWLPAGEALWDSSALLSEQSIVGELLYAVLGYESSPSAIQVTLYLLSLAGILIAWSAAHYQRVHHDQ